MIAERPALADTHPTHAGVVSADPDANTPDVLDGHVSAFAQVGDTMIVGGKFSKVRQGPTTYNRSNIFAFDVNTGAIDTSFRPVVRGEVFGLQLTPSKNYVVAVGAFGSVGSTPNTARVVALGVDDGTVLTTFRPPVFDDTVRDIHFAHGRYYLTGDFTRAGSVSRSGLASLNTSGKLTTHARTVVTGTFSGRPGVPKIQTSDISPNGKWMVIGGSFANVSGKSRPQIALLSLTGGRTKLAAWSTRKYAPICQKNFNTYMRDIAFAPQSSYFVVATTGGPKGFQRSGRLCDTATRWQVKNQPNQSPSWVDYTGGDTLTQVIVDRRVIYIGGPQRWLNNSYGRNTPGAGAVRRDGLAALDPANGLPMNWNPGRTRGYGVYGFALTAQGLWVGSDTTTLGGEQHARLGLFPIAGGSSVPPYATGRLPGRLLQLAPATGSGAVNSRSFNGSSVGKATTVSTNTSWSKVRGAFVVDKRLYAAWPDGTLRSTPLTGGGPLTRGTPIALDGGFTDLAKVRTMFFDKRTHRLYYTLAGSKALYYRYFQPESNIVGSWRYRAADRTMKWSGVRGSFVVGSRLFFVQNGSGQLQSIRWATTGTSLGKPKAVGKAKIASAATVLTN
jgi:hypothetical protein